MARRGAPSGDIAILCPLPRPAWLRPVVAGGAAAIALLAVLADGYFYPGAEFAFAVWLVVGVIGLS